MRRLFLISLLLATLLCLAGTVMAFTGGEQFFISQDQKQLESADKTRAFGIDSDRNWRFAGGSLVPAVTNSLDLGSSSLKWRKAYLAGLIYADGGMDRSSAAALAIGATHATSVVITPATTITGALTATGGILAGAAVSPSATATHDLGTSSAKWRDAYLSRAAYVAGQLYADGGVDRSTAAVLTLGGTNASGVTVTPLLTATAGITTPENITISAAGKGLKVKEGTNALMGTASLSGGEALVETTAVKADSRIFVTGQTTTGACYVKSRVNDTSFSIYSTDGSDAGTAAWIIVQPAP